MVKYHDHEKYGHFDNPQTKFVNLWQSPDERKEKYWLCRTLGESYSSARRMRDWRLTKIEEYFIRFYGAL